MKVKASRTFPAEQLADQLVMASIRLTRTLRALNRSSQLSGPQLSIMAAVVFSERIAARDLSKLEEVTPATISRQLAELESAGLLTRERDARDTRVQWIKATAQGRRLVMEGHQRRLRPLVDALARLPASEQAVLSRAVATMADLTARMRREDA
jgi:DNA-binding MarR family transcriptional regulator